MTIYFIKLLWLKLTNGEDFTLSALNLFLPVTESGIILNLFVIGSILFLEFESDKTQKFNLKNEITDIRSIISALKIQVLEKYEKFYHTEEPLQPHQFFKSKSLKRKQDFQS